jgi:hypothetical protein
MKFNRELIPNNDFLKAIVNRTAFKHLPSTIGVNSEGQSGKSTMVFWYANRIACVLKYGSAWQKHKNEWDLWDYKKYCTTDLEQFVQLYDESWGETLVLEEAADQGMDTTSYFNMFSQTYARISRTQGVHLNRVFLVTPFLNDLLKIHKRKITFIAGRFIKLDHIHKAIFGWRKVQANTLILKEDNIECKWRKNITLNYSDEFLKASTEYTDWLKLFKKDIMTSIKKDVKRDIAKKAFKEKIEHGEEPIGTPIKINWDN